MSTLCFKPWQKAFHVQLHSKGAAVQYSMCMHIYEQKSLCIFVSRWNSTAPPPHTHTHTHTHTLWLPPPLHHSTFPRLLLAVSLIMNPTGVLFIRQAGGERPASRADPATLSSLGIWHRNFNRRATQARRSVQETHCACQSGLTGRREHSECAAAPPYPDSL